jgi:hypothetical protein
VENPDANTDGLSHFVRAHLRHAEFYARLLDDARRGLAGGDVSSVQPHWAQIVHARNWCAANATANPRFAELCADFALFADRFLSVRVDGPTRDRWLDDGTEAAHAISDQGRVAAIEGARAMLLVTRKQYAAAIGSIERSLSVISSHGDEVRIGQDLDTLGLGARPSRLRVRSRAVLRDGG